MRSRLAATVLGFAAALLVIPVGADAGVVAAVAARDETSGNFDIRVFDPLDPSRSFALPAGALTATPETEPQLAADGQLLLFKRSAASAGGPAKLIHVDRAAGTVSTVSLPTNPFGTVMPFGLSPDGATIITAALSTADSGQPPHPTATTAKVLDTAALPAGPFPELAAPVVDIPDEGGQPTFFSILTRGHPSVNDARRYTWVVKADTTSDFVSSATTVLITGIVGGQSRATPAPGRLVNNPVLTPSDQSTITFDNGQRLFQVRLTATPVFSPITLPNLAFTGSDEQTEPQWTRSGRYLAWLSRPFTASDAAVPVRVFVYDKQTQQLVRPDGRLLGSFRFASGLTIAETPATVSTFTLSTAVISALTASTLTLNTSLLTPTSVGILVQRVAGTTRLLGRTVPRLVTVGRVPLGPRRRGGNRIAWNGRVNGRRLAPGTYRITMRAIARDGQPSDLSKPVTLRVR